MRNFGAHDSHFGKVCRCVGKMRHKTEVEKEVSVQADRVDHSDSLSVHCNEARRDSLLTFAILTPRIILRSFDTRSSIRCEDAREESRSCSLPRTRGAVAKVVLLLLGRCSSRSTILLLGTRRSGWTVVTISTASSRQK